MDNEDEQLIASAAQFLIDGGEEGAANVLLSCEMRVDNQGSMEVYTETNWHVGFRHVFVVMLECPRLAFDMLSDLTHPVRQAIYRAIEAVVPSQPHEPYVVLSIREQVVTIDPDWRSELLEIARGRGVHNQVTSGSGVIRTWNNLRFRSASEIRIAEALDRAGVLFLPNSKARLGDVDERLNREPDFLVCCEGRWGILEVDGEPFHPPSRTVHDHTRDRLFKVHGVRVVEHFDATECYNNPDDVVKRFLNILRQS
jgi:hypothetical protein